MAVNPKVGLTYQKEVGRANRSLPSDKSLWTREHYIQSCLKMVIDLAVYYSKCTGVDVEELVGEGNVGLCRAWDKYKPETGAKFSSVAYFWIRAYILKYVEDRMRDRNLFEQLDDYDWES